MNARERQINDREEEVNNFKVGDSVQWSSGDGTFQYGVISTVMDFGEEIGKYYKLDPVHGTSRIFVVPGLALALDLLCKIDDLIYEENE